MILRCPIRHGGRPAGESLAARVPTGAVIAGCDVLKLRAGSPDAYRMLWRTALAAAGGMGAIVLTTGGALHVSAASAPPQRSAPSAPSVLAAPPVRVAPPASAPSFDAATQADLSVSVPYTPPRATLTRYCRQLQSGGVPAPSYSFTSFVSETGGSIGSTTAWCRHFLAPPNGG